MNKTTCFLWGSWTYELTCQIRVTESFSTPSIIFMRLWDYLETFQDPTYNQFLILITCIIVKYIHWHVGEAHGGLVHPFNCAIWLFDNGRFSHPYKPYIFCCDNIHVVACHTCALGISSFILYWHLIHVYTYFNLVQPTRWRSRIERTPRMRKVGCSNPSRCLNVMNTLVFRSLRSFSLVLFLLHLI